MIIVFFATVPNGPPGGALASTSQLLQTGGGLFGRVVLTSKN
jgi:hypothetical protein